MPSEKLYVLPGSMRVKFKASPKDSGAWKKAAARLAPSNQSAVYGLGGLLGETIGPEYRVLEQEDYDPWLRIKPTLLSDPFRRPVLNCLKKLPAESRRRVHSYGLHWEITPTGQALKARVENAQTQNPDSESLRQCILRTLENSAWPCTPSGKTEAIQARICLEDE